ncbi:MAG: hypothetical protein LUC18_05245 [Porphyromonadaceae bacterium]|nr:hypothetical protein [Porphyromonadaceae bacterium]
MFWNLENFFDYIDQGTSDSDAEFSSRGALHWTKARFYAKCDAVAKMILWVGDRYGSLPAVVGFAEVENGWVLRQLVSSTALKKFGYRIVHYESPDIRGIDVALIYREDVFDLLTSKPCHVYTEYGSVMRTRDILLVSLQERQSGEVTYFAVNHHPSKYGGEAISRPKRLAAMTRLRDICDSVAAIEGGWHLDDMMNVEKKEVDSHSDNAMQDNNEHESWNNILRIIAMGDFNDTPDNPLFGIFGDTMVNKAYPLYRKGFGTIKYQGKWELIDMFIISSAMDHIEAEYVSSENDGGDRKGRREGDNCNYRMEIIEAPFHIQRDNAHVGEKPLRTYSGPRYLGGISDHFPIVLVSTAE